jgi:alkylation response protein AidB-like acyl-CoA dehydrogenase
MPANAVLKASVAPQGDWLSREEIASLTPQIMKERVQALVPLIASHAEEAERIRRPVDEVWNALRKAGVFYQMVPKVYGGLEFGPEDFLDVMLPIGEACASTCWVSTFCVEHNWLFAMFSKEAQDDIFGRFPYITAPGMTSPPGKAVRVPGGYRLTGKWRWGTGVMHADWIMAMAMIEGDNPPVPHYFMVPVEDSIIHDTWYVDGMAGTGSNDVEVRDVFVPEERAMDMNLMRIGQAPGTIYHRSNGSKAFRMPMTAFMGLTAAIAALGAARNAVAWWT